MSEALRQRARQRFSRAADSAVAAGQALDEGDERRFREACRALWRNALAALCLALRISW